MRQVFDENREDGRAIRTHAIGDDPSELRFCSRDDENVGSLRPDPARSHLAPVAEGARLRPTRRAIRAVRNRRLIAISAVVPPGPL